jgi:hypothetical protein
MMGEVPGLRLLVDTGRIADWAAIPRLLGGPTVQLRQALSRPAPRR